MPCPFCQLSSDRVVWASDTVVAIRDGYPVTEGHTLVITRRHVGTYFDATATERSELWRAVDAIKAQLDAELSPDGYNVGFNVGPAAGQTVMHLHIHVIPRRVGDMDDPRGGVRGVIPWKQQYEGVASVGLASRVVVGGREDPLLGQVLPALDGATIVDLALAFVFDRGVELLHDRLIEVLQRKHARVRLVTGDYQDVTEPAALRHLLALPSLAEAQLFDASLEVRAYRVKHVGGDSFHPKAWIIRGPGAAIAWVGSANLSQTALQTGVEWNYQLVEPAQVGGVHEAFEALWTHPSTELVDLAWVDAYERRRSVVQRGGVPVPVAVAEDAPTTPPTPRPGSQSEALLKLEQTRLQDNRAGLVILATGLGKTYVSAFDSCSFQRVLFVAHREEILTQAMETYRRVRPKSRFGMYYGHTKEPDADMLFASVQTLSARENIEVFDPQRFDYIVIDEFHHAAADTYRRVIDYFEPKFMLGLTATPDRLDGVNLLALCEGNEVYRADIPKGIEEKALSPFHYYGLGDPTQYERIPWRRYTDEKLADLVGTEERAQHALESLRRYTQGRVRALGFCVTQSHADFMADYFGRHGVDCRAVYSGSEAPRASTLEALANGEIEIVFCVDMFNEGLDVPKLDTVLMLRPTQSSIVWLQQLGRGLRYVKDKTLTVLDFIGNHAIFLRRPEILLSALRIEIDRGKAPWQEASYKALLPPGVTITFDLEAQNVLETLRAEASKAGTKAERWYRAFRDQRGERPTAIEADEAGWFKQLSKKGGGWFAFVAEQGDLSSAEKKVGEQLAEFLVELEKLPRTRSYKLLVLLALLHLGAFPGRARKRDICEAIAARAGRSAALMRDLSVDGRDPKAIEKLLDKDAFPRLAKVGKGRLFKINTKYFDTTGLSTDEPDALASMTRELVELHLGRYLENANRSSTRLPPMLADDGSPIDARFDVERTGDETSIIFHSRGGKRGTQAERNTQYKEGLALLLSRLRQAHLTILRIEVDSDQVKRRGLTQNQRTVAVPGHSYPIAMKEVTDPLALARAIGNGAKRVGQTKGATGGNDTKRIRIALKEPVPAGELWGRLFRR